MLDQVTPRNTKITNSLDAGENAHESRVLEAPLVRQADGELKNELMKIEENKRSE